ERCASGRRREPRPRRGRAARGTRWSGGASGPPPLRQRLRGGHAERARRTHAETARPERVGGRRAAGRELRLAADLPDSIALKVRRRVADPLAVLVDGVAERVRLDDDRHGRAELVDERHETPGEAARAERLVALEVIDGGDLHHLLERRPVDPVDWWNRRD